MAAGGCRDDDRTTHLSNARVSPSITSSAISMNPHTMATATKTESKIFGSRCPTRRSSRPIRRDRSVFIGALAVGRSGDGLHRRDFLKVAVASCIATTASTARANQTQASQAVANDSGSAQTQDRNVVTVTGPLPPEELGRTLPHEHVMVDFIGADRVSRNRYRRDRVAEVVRPHLEAARQAGCETLVECTPAYLGRDATLLKRLSEATGVRILTNTGYYGARRGKFLPRHAATETADQLAARWLEEWRGGIGGTGIRPGFIKIGVDNGPLTEVNRKLVRAAARTHLDSGLTIACHTGDGAAALEEMALLNQEGVDPSAWIWVHAQTERDTKIHRKVAEHGGWVEWHSTASVSPASNGTSSWSPR